MVRVLVLFLIIFLMMPWPQAQAQELLAGGLGGNLVVREGKVVIQSETLDIKLHLGFAEVEQDFVIKNGETAQKVVFGFPYHLGRSDQSVNNFRVTANDDPIEVSSTKESDGEAFLYWKIFELQFAPGQTGNIKIKHWQMNGANIRGMRTFNYSLKNKLHGQIGKLNIRLTLMDGVNLENFNRSVNPDLDLKLEPLGWTKEGTALVWAWPDLVPNFDIIGNFYWSGGDLAKTANLNQALGQYQVTATSNSPEASQTSDSSYLTAWKEGAAGPGVGESLDLIFPEKNITEIRIIPGLATSQENYLNFSRPNVVTLDFGNGAPQTITLADKMTMQYFPLYKPIMASQLKITLSSVYTGSLTPDDTYITEIELGSDQTPSANQSPAPTDDRPAWQKFLINLWQKFLSIFK